VKKIKSQRNRTARLKRKKIRGRATSRASLSTINPSSYGSGYFKYQL
jgi:hypothetical protein